MSCSTLLLLLSALPAAAQPDFPDGLHFAGAAHLASNALRLTDAKRHQAGAVWFERKQTVTSGFDTTFRFQLTQQGGLGNGADGFAFVLQNSSPQALGGRGSAGGFALGEPTRYGKGEGIPRSIAIFFDTFLNPEIHDPSDNYIGIFTAGTPKKLRWPPPRLAYTRRLPVDLKDGHAHSARILFQPPILSVYLDDRPAITSTIDLATVVDPQGAAYIGFTASTGNGFENHDILTWSFNLSDVSSTTTFVSSSISFLKTTCLPDRNLCTPDRAQVDAAGPGIWHIVLPANLEWGAAIPNPSGRPVTIENARGIACWDLQAYGAQGCNGPSGNKSGAGALISRVKDGRTWFSIDDRTGNFRDNEGYFEFDARLQ